jgi:hypothetical protein
MDSNIPAFRHCSPSRCLAMVFHKPFSSDGRLIRHNIIAVRTSNHTHTSCCFTRLTKGPLGKGPFKRPVFFALFSSLLSLGRCYVEETIRRLEIFVKEHKCNLTQGLLEKSKLAQHEYEVEHKICQKEAKVLQIEPNTAYRKYKESAHMSLIEHPISQPSLDISPIWPPVITAKPESYNAVQCRLCVKIVFLYWYHTENLSL